LERRWDSINTSVGPYLPFESNFSVSEKPQNRQLVSGNYPSRQLGEQKG
jgi:hypothetical protein